MKLILSFVICAVGLVAQTAIIPTAQLCPAGQIGSYTVTGAVGSFSLLKFTCIPAPTAPVCPTTTQIAHVETFIPPTALINLAQSPLPGTPLISYFSSSILGSDKFIAIANPQQQLAISLPSNLSPTDSLTLIYWAAQ